MAARRAAAALLAATFIAGCGGGATAPRPTPPAKPALVLALIPDPRRPPDATATAAITTFLGAHTGTPVTLQLPGSYADVVDGLQRGTIDAAWLESLGYLAIKPRVNVNLVTRTAECLPTYTAAPKPAGCKPVAGRQSIILCSTGVTISELTDGRDWSGLKAKSFVFGDPASPGANLWPRYYMRRNHVDPDHDLAHPTVQPVAAAAALQIYNSQSDCGAFTGDPRPSVLNLAPDIFERTRVVFVAPVALPGDPQVISAGLNQKQAQALSRALLQMGTDGSIAGALNSLYGAQGLRPATDSDYDFLRRVVADVNPAAPAMLLPSPSASPHA
ncbi:MAG TPA: PhnD/SsuA/transferrin family substrate-binding protein [Candidatus Dormibacteraeota bacterium]